MAKWKGTGGVEHTSLVLLIAGNELSNSTTSSSLFPPLPSKSSSLSTNAALSLLLVKLSASSPRRARSRERKSSPDGDVTSKLSPLVSVGVAISMSV